jgi:hypothetical protein
MPLQSNISKKSTPNKVNKKKAPVKEKKKTNTPVKEKKKTTPIKEKKAAKKNVKPLQLTPMQQAVLMSMMLDDEDREFYKHQRKRILERRKNGQEKMADEEDHRQQEETFRSYDLRMDQIERAVGCDEEEEDGDIEKEVRFLVRKGLLCGDRWSYTCKEKCYTHYEMITPERVESSIFETLKEGLHKRKDANDSPPFLLCNDGSWPL